MIKFLLILTKQKCPVKPTGACYVIKTNSLHSSEELRENLKATKLFQVLSNARRQFFIAFFSPTKTTIHRQLSVINILLGNNARIPEKKNVISFH